MHKDAREENVVEAKKHPSAKVEVKI